MERENDLVLFRNYGNPLIAQFHKTLLEQNGIPCILKDLGFNFPTAFFSDANAGIKILVRNRDLNSAFDLMAEDDEDDDFDFDTVEDDDQGDDLDIEIDFDDDDFDDDDFDEEDLRFDEKDINEGFELDEDFPDDFDEESLFDDDDDDFGFEEDETDE
jgi:hypothetical protein